MKKEIEKDLEESIDLLKDTKETQISAIEEIAAALIYALKNGKKIIVFGNGGSAADAQHIVAELVGRFEKNRKALSAISLTTNTSSLTALANDFGFETVFSRQIEALGVRGDIALGISTSGESKNIILAIQKAKQMGLTTIAFSAGKGGELAKACDLALVVNSKRTCRIQEAHIAVAHILCSLIEESLDK